MGLNKAIIMGRLTVDPELKRTQGGISVTNFGVAVDRNYKQGAEREVDFLSVVAWRGTAEFITKYFHKGSMIVVEGSLQTRKWEDKHNQKRVEVEIVADNVYFGEAKKQDTGYSAPAAAPSYGSAPYVEADGFRPLDDNEHVPF